MDGSMQPKSLDMFEVYMACRLKVLWSLHGAGLRKLKFDSRVRGSRFYVHGGADFFCRTLWLWRRA